MAENTARADTGYLLASSIETVIGFVKLTFLEDPAIVPAAQAA